MHNIAKCSKQKSVCDISIIIILTEERIFGVDF
jgi:hypothetical protein